MSRKNESMSIKDIEAVPTYSSRELMNLSRKIKVTFENNVWQCAEKGHYIVCYDILLVCFSHVIKFREG